MNTLQEDLLILSQKPMTLTSAFIRLMRPSIFILLGGLIAVSLVQELNVEDTLLILAIDIIAIMVGLSQAR